MKSLLIFLLSFFFCSAMAQVPATSAELIIESIENRQILQKESLVKNLPLKNIGPTVMSGRVVDLDVNPNNSIEFYVAYASGGLWYTNNNGTSFIPVMDNAETQNLGDIAVDWKTGTIWAGTGENNSSRSSYAGIGILKSSDKGKTWHHMGFSDAHHTGRILLNPENPNEVTVGVLGHLYSPNAERGVYKTKDGGKTWSQTLYLNDQTGIIDLAQVPGNSNILYAAAWEKDRKAWDFLGNGSNSGIYKSTDAGDTWQKISVEGGGFPTDMNVGRIGLAVFDQNTIYALLDNQGHREKSDSEKPDADKLTATDFKGMSKEAFLELDDKKLNAFLKANGFQEKYRAENVKQLVRSGVAQPKDLTKYLENANAMMFDTPVIGAEVYRSDDGGRSWKKQNKDYIDDFYYSYGYYFGEIRVDPNDLNKIYIGGVPLLKSSDGGKTFSSISKENVHADHQALWVDPKQPGHLINGNDGGVNITYDDGENWIKNNSASVGQFYAINVDNQEPYHVYGGLQDNGVWAGPHNSKEDTGWHQSGRYAWQSLMGGDGMQIEIDKRNSDIVYTGYQFGNYYRIDRKNDKRTYIQPKHELGESPYRFNWQTPIQLSAHNQDILYLGSNKLHRSLDQGDNWETISGDLTQGGKKGNVAYGTLTTISESPLQFGLIYTGSDDGLVHVSKNGGGDWLQISDKLTKDLWVSRVIASQHQKERVYVALNGYRWDDFTAYLYKSDDYGATWEDISSNIPDAPINVIIEDPINDSVLYAGSDNGLYISFDQGTRWEALQKGLPPVAIHDLVIQPKAKHLLVGTHGRSIYLADIRHIQQMTPEVLSKDLFVFDLDTISHSSDWGNSPSPWSRASTPGLDIGFYSKSEGAVKAEIQTLKGVSISSTEFMADKGLNILSFDVAFTVEGKKAFLKKNKTKLIEAKNGKTYLPKGSYKVILKKIASDSEQVFQIK
ncbi:MAG: glycosyl hydrolase [Pseudozobellia sp.]|nr:glycosyl hydrolase [Pseudozobellia sp.]MBG49114.1 glycosyl hydrolase [Pseudozobellia sp.]|tara:strand:+ start:334 stop:3183 length:2850 start_codon:yes stop_codon:yes gene_type:complete